MKKVIIELTDDDLRKFERVEAKAEKFMGALSDIYSELYSWYKHGPEPSKTKNELWEYFHEVLRENALEVEDIS